MTRDPVDAVYVVYSKQVSLFILAIHLSSTYSLRKTFLISQYCKADVFVNASVCFHVG